MTEAPATIFTGNWRHGSASFLHSTRRITLSTLILLSIGRTITASSVSLTQLMPQKIEKGIASVGLNHGYGSIWWPPEAKPIRIGERTFAHGLGMRANNTVTYRLDGRYHRFQGWV
ncbi:MAG: NPCBM/NEW2 domain-containing protein [Terriglobia bacterium]